MISVSVSNLDFFRSWRADEEADLDALFRRLRGEEPQTEPMKAGEALHAALENFDQFGDVAELQSGEYRFYIKCEAVVDLPPVREQRMEKQYGDLIVRGRVDGRFGQRITDYKTTAQFDPERLLDGYQWRFYLDMADCDWFIWKVFVIRHFGEFVQDGKLNRSYEVVDVHELSQHRYARLEADCQRLAADYLEFARQIGEEKTRRVYAENRQSD